MKITVKGVMFFLGVALLWGAIVFGILCVLKGVPWNKATATELEPESYYGVAPTALASAAGCGSYEPAPDQFPPKQLIGTCTVDDHEFTVSTFDTDKAQYSYLLTNSVLDEPLYYVYVPGGTFRSEDSNDENWDDPDSYEPVRDAAQQLADQIDGRVLTAANVRELIKEGQL